MGPGSQGPEWAPKGERRVGQECGKGWGPFSTGALDSVPLRLLDMNEVMIDPKPFQEVS